MEIGVPQHSDSTKLLQSGSQLNLWLAAWLKVQCDHLEIALRAYDGCEDACHQAKSLIAATAKGSAVEQMHSKSTTSSRETFVSFSLMHQLALLLVHRVRLAVMQ
jgi:hypothetical protein